MMPPRLSLISCLFGPCLWGLLLQESAAVEVAFRRHVINRQSEFSACAVFDVNRDGKLDIFCGGYWYEGPDWKPHRTRDVEMIRGRADDYSNLPLDVNQDGWTDVVSVNYRSGSLYWVEHPGPSGGLWKKHVIDTPGPSETGRLADIDGDGRLDVLPNGTRFAAWYELSSRKDDGDKSNGKDGRPVDWLRHDLPGELAGHGIGFGDIDGDGRGDLVNSKGWAKAPETPRTGRWRWHDEFQLHRDVSIPMLVWDVDQDGDSDLVWGRGHNTGLYWLEQTSDEQGGRHWRQHAIDTSWSQAHAIMQADINGDGRLDLVAGKRYLGHDGKDLGEYDPLVIYWYEFDPSRHTWRRHLVSWGDDCGFDLDPKCADVDGDGDIDIVAAGRGGLFLLENLGPISRPAEEASGPDSGISSQLAAVPEYERHDDLLQVIDRLGQRQDVASAWDWGRRRSHILGNMERVMGPLPPTDHRVPLDVEILSEEDTPNYVRRRITFAANPGGTADSVDRVPAYLLIPKRPSGPRPAMLCLHPTSPLGKSQICGLGGKPSRFYAHELAERGFVCLAPDYPSFGEYDQYDFANDGFVSGTMKGIWNHIRAVDVLEAMPEVQADRIGVIGHSLGGHNALFVAAFDQRLRVIVTSCGFNAFEDYYGGNLKGWTSDRYMPRIRDEYEMDPRRMPFDFHEILGAMAPRPVFINAPLHDANFAVVGVKKTVASAGAVYKLHGKTDDLHVVYPDCGHDFPEEIRHSVYQWLDRHLR